MARIRSIKPEFAHSESMGRVSRDARLCFVLLWTIADDSGRLRGNSRMLASLLFPYDSDAPKLIDRWLSELESENCVIRYKVSGDNYIEIRNWLAHQRIDKPSESKIPAFANVREDSRNGRERSSLEWNGVDGNGMDQDRDQGAAERIRELSATVVEAWNQTPGTTPVRKLSDKRRASLRSRLADADWDWRAALARFPLKCFASRPEGYVPDFEFFLRPDTVNSILEGKYDWRKSETTDPADRVPLQLGEGDDR